MQHMDQQCRIHPLSIIVQALSIKIKYFNTILFSFFQQQLPLMAEGERVGIVFANLDAIHKYREELLTVTVAGIDGTFKTVPRCPPQFTKGCLLTFQVVLKNVVSINSIINNLIFLKYIH